MIKTRNRIATLWLLSLFFLSLPAQTESVRYTAGSNTEGVTYYLPKTALQITVRVRHITRTAGEFGKYADRYLRMNNVIENEDSYREIDDIEVKEIGIPDTEKIFTVKFSQNSSGHNIRLSNDGIIMSVNASLPVNVPVEEKLPVLSVRANPKRYLTEEILLSGSKAKMAELTAKEIYSIRESKNAITRGQADNMPKDGESLKIVLKALNEQEDALMQLFTGITDTVISLYSLTVTPENGQEINQSILFRFSRKLGLLSSSDLAGSPVYYSLKDLNLVAAPAEGKKKTSKWNGIVCNIPAKARLSIYNNKESFYDETLSVAQWGNTEVLSSQLFKKGADTQVIFDTATGAVKQIRKKE